MIFQVVHPFVMTINGDSLKTAVKNFIKLKHGLNLSKIILADQNRYYEAAFDYYKHNGRNKVGIDYTPASSTIITSLGLPTIPVMGAMGPMGHMGPMGAMGAMGPMGVSAIGVPTADVMVPTGPLVGPGYDIGPTVGQVITPVASVISPIVTPVRPIVTDGNGLVATERAVAVTSGATASVASIGPITNPLSILSPMSPLIPGQAFAPVIVDI